MVTLANPADPLGYDAFVDTDITPTGASCSGAVLVQNAILHRLMAETLPLIGAPGGRVSYGVNVRKWVQEVTNQELADAKAPLIAAVIARDTRVDPGSIQVTVSPTVLKGALANFNISIQARTTTQLPIAMVVNVTAVTVQMLAQGT